MNRNTASISFLVICLTLGALLLTQVITPIVSAAIFSIALVLFGSLSKGFRTKKESAEKN